MSMDQKEKTDVRKEKRFSIEEMEADRRNAVCFICEAFGFTDIRPGDSMVRLAQRIKEWRAAALHRETKP